jgi:hypothetical protein
MRFRVTLTDRPSDSPPYAVRRWFRPRRRGFAVRVRWSEGYEDRLLSALVRQIEHDIAIGAQGHRTSRTLEEVFATKSGHVLIEADEERIADEAEGGYDPATMTPRVTR